VLAVGDAVNSAQELARAVLAGTRAALRSSILRMLEPQDGAWVNNNFWGDQRTAPLPESEGKVVSILAKNTHMYGPPAVHSVQVARGDGTVPANADVRGRVSYGCGGAYNSFEFDWIHGAQFSLVCNSLTLEAVTYAPRALSPYQASGASVFLAAAVAKGTTVSQAQLTYTEPGVILDTGLGNTATYDAVDFARAVTVFNIRNDDPSVPTGIILDFIDLGGSLITRYDIQLCAGGARLPLPGNTARVSVTNASGSDAVIQVMWFLGL